MKVHSYLPRHFFFRLTAVVVYAAAANAMGDEFLLGIDNSRMKISSGIFRVTGKTIQTIGNKEPSTVNEECFVVFDYDKRCYRFERDGERTFLQTAECFYERWKNKPGTSDASITQYELHEPPIARVNPFDIRNLGFFTCYGLYYNSQYEEFRGFLLNGTKTLKKEDGALASISVVSNKQNDSNRDEFATFQIWLSKQQGYTTTRIQVNTFQVSDISWEKMKGVYVPVSFRQRYTSASSGLKIEADWVLTWESVNESIPSEMFTYQSLKKESDSVAVLYSSNADDAGRPVALDHFGSPPDSNTEAAPGKRISLSKLMLYNGLFLLLIGAGYVVSSILRKKPIIKSGE